MQCMTINQVKWSMGQLLAMECFRFFSLRCSVLAKAHPSCLGNQDNAITIIIISPFPLLADGILSFLLKQCSFALWNYKFCFMPHF